MTQLTPMMKQYLDIKEEYSDAILFFRLGDFYEMFFTDAELASRELEIVLTARDGGNKTKVPMCGIPYHAAKTYIARLIKKGYKVAICEQVSDPKAVKGIVEREVVRVITPGTVIDEQCLETGRNNYLASIYLANSRLGLAYVDYSTGELYLVEFNINDHHFYSELMRLSPTEIIYNQGIPQQLTEWLVKQLNTSLTQLPDTHFSFSGGEAQFKEIFNTTSLEELKLGQMLEGVRASCALLKYLRSTQKEALNHLQKPVSYSPEKYMILDTATIRNLEIMTTINGQKERGSLLWVLDKTVTAMGSRLLRRWINQPLLDINLINYRQDAIAQLMTSYTTIQELRQSLKGIYDLERLIGKINTGNASPLDLLSLKQSLTPIPKTKTFISGYPGLLADINGHLDELADVVQLIEVSINPDASNNFRIGEVIKPGYSPEIDEFRQLARDSKSWLMELEDRERKSTGIKSLKVGYNKVFGYFLEVRKGSINLVPSHYHRKQTLANAERFIIEELKVLESKILGAEEKLSRLEQETFNHIKATIIKASYRIQQTASAIGQVDLLSNLALIAFNNDYTRPIVETGDHLILKDARHPVIEQLLQEQFVTNNISLNNTDQLIHIITGPNMAGKSTFARTVALLTLLAQTGSYIPASSCKIGIVDRIFARVGASDDLTTGQSTFMVEMNEVANILNNATQQSLIILDEVGRGTSTYDGLSIAWAITEYLHHHIKAKTIFTTHYHELTQLSEQLPGVQNYNVMVKEEQDQIRFLYKIIPGCANKSYGIQVAKLAGLPKQLLVTAKKVLNELEQDEQPTILKNSSLQLSLDFISEQGIAESTPNHHQELEDLLSQFTEVEVHKLTPLEAINLLAEYQTELARIRK